MDLFIIGNGFDIAHGLKTKYQDFANYLKINNINLYDKICTIYGNLSDEDILWKNFEKTMESIDEDFIRVDTNFDLEYNDLYDDNLKGMIEEKIKNKLLNISEELFEYFEQWAESIDTKGIKKVTSKIKSSEENEDLFLTFNYNFLLENSYDVDSSQICYIHNSIGKELILGHGNKLKIKELEKELSFLNENDEETTDTIDSLEEKISIEENLEYYNRTYKNTEKIISLHKEFFKSLTEVENIYIIGHSLGDVDFPYFKEVLKNVSTDTKWFVYYYDDEDKKEASTLKDNLKIKPEKIEILNSCEFYDLV